MATKIFMDFPGGLKIPAIGLGTGSIREETEIEKTLGDAFELGYRHLDTAYIYQNEVTIGHVLKKCFSSGKLKREDLFITTKLPLPGIHQDRVDMFMNRSLQNLQLEYVDLYLIHNAIGTKYFGEDSPDNIKEVDDFDHLKIWKKMEEQVYLERAKTIGLSNFNIRQIERIMKSARIKPACLQVELHVDFQQPDLVNFCHQNGIVVVAYSPLGAPGAKRFENRKVPVAIDSEIIKNTAKKYDKSPGQIMLKYLVQKNIVAIPKTTNKERLEENISIFDFEINTDDMKTLEGLDGGEKIDWPPFYYFQGKIFRYQWTKHDKNSYFYGLADSYFSFRIENHPEYPFKK